MKPDDPERFYYFRDDQNRPLVTVCLIPGNPGYSRGVAYCSPKDAPNKKVGRNIAKGRAIRALKRSGRNDVVSREEVYKISDTVGVSPFPFKSSFPALLSVWEQELLGVNDAS